MKYRKLITALLIVATLLPLTSALAYGIAGYTWWVPLGEYDLGRALVIWFAHIVPPFASIGGMLLMWECGDK